ncbi:MAG: ATP-dependent DNA helicase RecQ [Bradymonadaceae bacterium]
MTIDRIQNALEEIFGYAEFRPGQRQVIEAVLDGDDLLAIMPTGAGKSLCYQLSACLMEGTALVVSPLIALMQDQLESLRVHGVDAALINSSLDRRQRRRRLQQLGEGAFDLLYVAPERFQSDPFLEALEKADVSLLAIDEAHCISHWGHDFRPDYLALGDARERVGEPPVLALTATATRQVQQDILEQLGLRDADVVLGGFERPNLRFEVYEAAGEQSKVDRIEEVASRDLSASTVVYCATRRQVDDVAGGLRERDFVVGTYHGGMSSEQRHRTQDRFMAGDFPVLVATNAFGMGVDKADIRTIVHYNMPGSLEAYYQEAGRAGRDGEPAHCLLLYQPSDRGIHEFFIENSYPEATILEAVWKVVSGEGLGEHELSPEQIAEHVSRKGGGSNVHPWAVETSLKHLEQGGHVSCEWRRDRHIVEVQDRARRRDLRVDWQRIKEQRRVNEDHLEDVVNYATGRACRASFLLHYFGATPSFGDQCGRCDNCIGRPVSLPGDDSDGTRFSDPPETVVRKVLSAVARAPDRATRLDVASMLRGSEAERIVEAGYPELSTYGLLASASQHALVRTVEACTAADLVVKSDRSGLQLSEVGVDVMTGEIEVPPTLKNDVR